MILLVLLAAATAVGWAASPALTTTLLDPVRAAFSDDPAPAQAQATEAAASTAPSDITASAAPTQPATPARRHRVRIATRPQGAKVIITPPDGGPAITGTTPFATEVPEGRPTVTVTHRGRQPLTRRVKVDRNRVLRWWLDPRGQLHHKVAQFRTGSAPKQVAFSPDGRELWVTLLGGPGVEVYRPRSGRRLATVDLGDHGAVEVIFTADGTTAFASQMESASVFEIDTATRRVRRQLRTGGSWTKVMALSPDESRLYASNWSSNDVSEIDLDTGRVRRRLRTVATPRGLFVTDDGDTLYVAGFDAGQVQRIDLRDGSSRILETTGGAMRHLVGDPDRGRLYADDMGTDAVYVHDMSGRRVRELADTDAKPNTIDLGADGRVLYVSNRGANNPQSYYLPGPEWGSVLAFDARSGEPLDAIVGGNQTTGLDVSDDGSLLAFSDFLDNRVQVYEVPPHDELAAGDGGRFGRHRADLVK
ncbi:MAG TPA: beta-propeller fold lactonase family protein [Euzebyales bacterium]